MNGFEFDMPDFFWWWGAFWEWRDRCKNLWRKRFAFWPVQMGNSHSWRSNSKYVWLGTYWIKGDKCRVETKHHKTGGIFGGPYTDWGFTYWVWERVNHAPAQERENVPND